MNIFRIEYYWYEGDHELVLFGKDVEQNQFEDDLIGAKAFAEGLCGTEVEGFDYLGKGYSVQCLPEYFGQICWYLETKLGYVICHLDNDLMYEVQDGVSGSEKIAISLLRKRSLIKSENVV